MARLKVILWDIDGTLIRSGGAGEQAWLKALKELHGIDASMHGISWAGQTDPYISTLFFQKFQIPGTQENITRFLEKYVDHLPGELERSKGKVLPGILEILRHIDASGEVEQGLLTGNLVRGAQYKLGHFGLWKYFRIGGFADGHFERAGIAREALKKARERWGGAVEPEEILVIGDTPFDIDCGRAIGARTAGVGTGYCDWDALEARRPDYLFRDLGNVENFLVTVGIKP